MKKFKFSSIYQCITPLFYISKIICLAPFCLPLKNGDSKTSILDYMYFLSTELCCLYIFYYSFERTILNFETFQNRVHDYDVLAFCIIVGMLWINWIAIISILSSMLMRQKINQILKFINECDEKV